MKFVRESRLRSFVWLFALVVGPGCADAEPSPGSSVAVAGKPPERAPGDPGTTPPVTPPVARATVGGTVEIRLSSFAWGPDADNRVEISAEARRTGEAARSALDCAPVQTVGACFREDCKLGLAPGGAAAGPAVGKLTVTRPQAGGAAIDVTPGVDHLARLWQPEETISVTAAAADVPAFTVAVRAPSKLQAWKRDLGTTDEPLVREGVVVLPPLDRNAGLPTSWVFRGQPWGSVETRISSEVPTGIVTVSCLSPMETKASSFPPALLEGLGGGVNVLLVRSEATTIATAANGEPLNVRVVLQEYVTEARFTLR